MKRVFKISFLILYIFNFNPQLNICAFYCQHLFGSNFLEWCKICIKSLCYLGQICIKFGANLASKLKIFMSLLMVLFGTNLVSNISTKASQKAPYLMPNYHNFLMQVRFKFDAQFRCDFLVPFTT